jgi:hypothetical protein
VPSALTIEFPADNVDHHGVRSQAVPVVDGQCSRLFLCAGVGVHPTHNDSAWTIKAVSATAQLIDINRGLTTVRGGEWPLPDELHERTGHGPVKQFSVH